MKIWAHRGCSQMYPENTVMAFSKAMEIEGLSGIELDIHMTKLWLFMMSGWIGQFTYKHKKVGIVA